MYLLLVAVGLHCCAWAFSSCSKWGLLSSCGVWCYSCGFSYCRAWALGQTGFSSCSSWALDCKLISCGAWTQLLDSMWDLPGPGIKPVTPALAVKFLTTGPPRKSRKLMHFYPEKFSSPIFDVSWSPDHFTVILLSCSFLVLNTH